MRVLGLDIRGCILGVALSGPVVAALGGPVVVGDMQVPWPGLWCSLEGGFIV
jgi:hypothetical protein